MTASTSSAPPRMSAAAGLSQDIRSQYHAAIWPKTSAPNRKASATSPRIARTTVRCAL